MYLIRDVFQAKPGKAKELVSKFKQTNQLMTSVGYNNTRIMTDFIADYWTVVLQIEVEDLDTYMKQIRTFTSQPDVAEIMKGYMDLVYRGKREIYKIE